MPIEVNQCDLECPLRAIRRAEWTQQSEGASLLRKAELAISVGVVGAAQAARSAADCPYRNAPEETWQASAACVEATMGLLAAGAVDPAKFNEREHTILDRYT